MVTAAAVATLLVVACADGPVEPAQDAVDFELASFDVLGDGYGYGHGGMGETTQTHAQSGAHVGARLDAHAHATAGLPVMGRLLAQAWSKAVRELGREAALELFSTLHTLRQEAHLARQAGDRELFREKVAAAHAEAARLIAEILGPEYAERLIELAKSNLALLEQAQYGRGSRPRTAGAEAVSRAMSSSSSVGMTHACRRESPRLARCAALARSAPSRSTHACSRDRSLAPRRRASISSPSTQSVGDA
jgi:hypothetical protein